MFILTAKNASLDHNNGFTIVQSQMQAQSLFDFLFKHQASIFPPICSNIWDWDSFGFSLM